MSVLHSLSLSLSGVARKCTKDLPTSWWPRSDQNQTRDIFRLCESLWVVSSSYMLLLTYFCFELFMFVSLFQSFVFVCRVCSFRTYFCLAWKATKWSSDPRFRGSYSFLPTGSMPDGWDVVNERHGRSGHGRCVCHHALMYREPVVGVQDKIKIWKDMKRWLGEPEHLGSS